MMVRHRKELRGIETRGGDGVKVEEEKKSGRWKLACKN